MISDYETELQSVLSLSSKSEGTLQQRARWRNAALHERCSMLDMVKLKEAFAAAPGGQLLPLEFRELLHDLLNVEYDDDEFRILFLKINSTRSGAIDWDQLVSHLILGYYSSDPEHQRGTLQPYILGLPTVQRSRHRHPVSRILFSPEVRKDRSVDDQNGVYITASRDGMINWWSLDMRILRTAYSASPNLKLRTTWVTDMAVMPDVNIIVTSSTERELRFYDCTAKTFTLKIVITSWEDMICTMHYHFHSDPAEQCVLVLGDVGGSVRLLLFSPHERGPFRNRPGKALTQLRHKDMQRKNRTVLSELHLVEFPRVHTDWVRQVSYYAPLHAFVSCSTCPDALLIRDVSASKTNNVFHVEKGIQCFAFEAESHVLVTGGPDCAVRVWSPFVPLAASAVLAGHRSAVVAVVLQAAGQIVYSLSRDRVLKVWAVQSQACLQTYIDIPSQVGERTPISVVYNPTTRELIMAAIQIAIITLDEQLNPKHTDGFTHSRAVAKILYNPLFKVVVTCGMDSIIICWDPITGKRNSMVLDAHTRLLHGEELPVEITAACFDPGYQQLLTGARNGSLKVWNFNTGLCLRTMSIEYMSAVTNVFWVEGRILAVGWNRHIIEFDDAGNAAGGKSWETRHTDDVIAAAARPPLSIATTSYNSELVLWKLETGQPYRRFSCTEPTLRIKMHYSKRDVQRSPSAAQGSATATATASKRPSTARRLSMGAGRAPAGSTAAVGKAQARRVSSVSLPARAQAMRQLAAHAAIFLETRPVGARVASLMVALENGKIQCWSDHPNGGFQGSFQGVHTAGDYVASFATDVNNEFLFTGTTVGYVKTWLMANYMLDEEVHVNMPRLRLQFPFLWRDRVEGRAKRCVRDQPLPLLLNSYRAHLRCITTLAYIDEQQLLLSGSSDYSVRVWRLSGEYLQTLGGTAPYSLAEPRFPPDVTKFASSTTLKVWQHGEVSRYTPGQKVVDQLRDITEQELNTKTFGAPAPEPLLGKYFALPARPERQDPIVLDDTLPTIPLYTHLRMASTQPVRRPPTPELVKCTRLRRSPPGRRAHFDRSRSSVRDKPRE